MVGVEHIYAPSANGLQLKKENNAQEKSFPSDRLWLERVEVLPRCSSINESFPPLRGRPRHRNEERKIRAKGE